MVPFRFLSFVYLDRLAVSSRHFDKTDRVALHRIPSRILLSTIKHIDTLRQGHGEVLRQGRVTSLNLAGGALNLQLVIVFRVTQSRYDLEVVPWRRTTQVFLLQDALRLLIFRTLLLADYKLLSMRISPEVGGQYLACCSIKLHTPVRASFDCLLLDTLTCQ